MALILVSIVGAYCRSCVWFCFCWSRYARYDLSANITPSRVAVFIAPLLLIGAGPGLTEYSDGRAGIQSPKSEDTVPSPPAVLDAGICLITSAHALFRLPIVALICSISFVIRSSVLGIFCIWSAIVRGVLPLLEGGDDAGYDSW